MINNSNISNYNGPSMNPTLKAGDQLRVVPYANRGIRVGDVVVFQASEGGNRHVTHRVVSVDARGVRTRGDNNNNTDSWILQTEEITGRVDSVLRGVKKVPIHGGRRGMIYALALRSIKRANLTISRILHPAYHRLADSGIFRRNIPHATKPQVFCFMRPNGVEMQLHLGPWIIGRRLPGQNHWHIKRPFKLFIDEATLP
jgi:signal peptidase I